MGLFTRKTKTRVWGTTGTIGIKKFIADKGEKAITITLHSPDLKSHSITIYGMEYELLDYIIRTAKFSTNPTTVLTTKK